MDWSVGFSPFVPWQALAGLAAVVAILLIPGILRRMRGAWWRLGAAAALLLALANPILLDEQREPQSTVVAIVVDQSASQKLDDRDKTTAAALTELQARLGQFKNVDVRTIPAGGPQAGALVDGTQLFGPLTAALSDVPPDRIGAVIMLTDGQVNDIPANRSALPPSAPLHVLLSGHDGEKDRRIVIDSAPRFGIVNEQQIIKYRVIDEGSNSVTPAHVTITDDGMPLASQTVVPGAPAQLTVNIGHEGPNVLEFEADALPGELTPINNRTAVEVQGIRENLRVLLVSGEPNAGERTWRNLLKSDPSVDLVHFTILRPPDKQDGTPINQLSLIAFPTRELFSDKLNQFDLIIFDRYQQQGVLPLPYFDNIAKYVQNGGAVLVAAGPDYADNGGLYDTPLSAVLPAAPTGKILNQPYKAEITDLGLKHPVTRGLPGAGTPAAPAANGKPATTATDATWSSFYRQIDVDKPSSGSVVMKGVSDKPLLILDHQGMGRVALLLTDDMWLWARGYEGGGPQVDLLRRLAHWLMKEPDLDEEALRASAQGGQLTIERQTMGDTTTPVTVVSPSGATQTLTLASNEPGLWRGTITADEVGLYRAQEDDKTAFAEVGTANPLEFADAISTPAKLAPLVKETGGRIGRMADASGNLDLPRIVPVRSTVAMSGPDWIGIHQTDATVLTGVNRIPLFYGFLGLFGIAGLFGLLALIGLPFATWVREGR
jgi:hypothetical protein